jgi:hypothetical protein
MSAHVFLFYVSLFYSQAVDRVFDDGRFQVIIWSKHVLWCGDNLFFVPSFSLYQSKVVAEHVHRFVVVGPVVSECECMEDVAKCC